MDNPPSESFPSHESLPEISVHEEWLALFRELNLTSDGRIDPEPGLLKVALWELFMKNGDPNEMTHFRMIADTIVDSCIGRYQDPKKASLHLPYDVLRSTWSHIAWDRSADGRFILSDALLSRLVQSYREYIPQSNDPRINSPMYERINLLNKDVEEYVGEDGKFLAVKLRGEPSGEITIDIRRQLGSRLTILRQHEVISPATARSIRHKATPSSTLSSVLSTIVRYGGGTSYRYSGLPKHKGL